MSECHEAVEVNGRYVCQAKRCPHRVKGGGCQLGKVSLVCSNISCTWNKAGNCVSMDVILDVHGRCQGAVYE